MNSRTAVVLPPLLVRLVDQHLQPLVLDVMRALRPAPPCVEPAGGHAPVAAHECDREIGLLREDECELHPFSFAKKAAAFFKIVLSISSSRTRFRSRESSSFSSVVSVPRVLLP